MSTHRDRIRQPAHAPASDLHILGVPSGHGAGDAGTAAGPRALLLGGAARQLQRHGWRARVRQIPAATTASASRADAAQAVARRLAAQVQPIAAAHTPFLVLGGDHSIAMGTWRGVARALQPRGPLGLVWIDAHMDAHTPATTPSGNVHGMPVADLLISQAIRPQHLCLVAVRSYEPGEAALLERLGVRVIQQDEVARIGMAAAIGVAVGLARAGTAGFGVSIDLDAIDPGQAPGVGTPVAGGLDGVALAHAMQGLAGLAGFLGLELVEYNPARDVGGRTLRLALRLIDSVFQKRDPDRAQKRPRTVRPT